MSPLEERIGYKFRNPLLLAEALTHPSVGHETPTQRHFDNQRLEFLGDAVLQLVITEYLYSHFSHEPEGLLTKLRSRLVSRDSLKRQAGKIELGTYMMIGRGEESTGGRQRSSTLADGYEALLGAIYLDSDLERVRRFILEHMHDELAGIRAQPVDVNPKGELQETLQAISTCNPEYKVLSEKGPEHEKTFVVRVIWEGLTLGEGSGPSKKQAETAAAHDAMKRRGWKREAVQSASG